MPYDSNRPLDPISPQPASKAILLVEDSDDDVLLFERALKLARFGNQVIRVADGAAAIDYLAGSERYADRELFPTPFAVLLDLRLPVTDGWEVLKWIRSRPELEKMLVVILSGSERHTTIKQAQDLGANTFLRKPCKADDLHSLAQNFPGDWQTRSA